MVEHAGCRVSRRGGRDSQRAKWRELARNWTQAPPPASPSREDLANFAAILAKRAPVETIGILGCTVGLRELALTDAAIGARRITCIDFTPEMIEATTTALSAFARARAAELEVHVNLDWLKLSSRFAHQFGAIVGDKSLDNLPFETWELFFSECSGSLDATGVLILHVGLVDEAYRNFDPTECLASWVQKIEGGRVELDSAASGFWEDLLTASAFAGGDARILSVGKYASVLEQLQDQASEGCARVLQRFAELFSTSLHDAWTAFNLDDVVEQAAPWFEIGDVRWSSDYEAARLQPIVELLPKGAK
jgi:predicted O-methyltransferase YrrM